MEPEPEPEPEPESGFPTVVMAKNVAGFLGRSDGGWNLRLVH